MAVGKCITSYDPSCLVATESARGSDGIQIGRLLDRPVRGARQTVFAVVGGGKWPDKFLALPIL
jgi:hypothetical protein